MSEFIKAAFAALACIAVITGCTASAHGWPDGAEELIAGSDSVMRVLTVNDPADSAFLRRSCVSIPVRQLRSETYKALERKMLATVTDPSQDGVGIAGPQVGVGCRIVAVQRFDKEGEPFEVYPNVRIASLGGDRVPGPEGCLSVPDAEGEVERWQDIEISYTSPRTLRDTTETVKGFTAVIFQHECDHLDGVLFTDYL
ncbi:MAG: peptide deformylase [Bacteroidales bacterium]|nr:peptide deformylase [Bacteroidales bacterium]